MKLIGRKDALEQLDMLMEKDRSQFVAVYGRRRVGKTFLVREYFGDAFAFYATGVADEGMSAQLAAFNYALDRYGSPAGPAESWLEAFRSLINLLESDAARRDPASGKLVVFIDELPWLDTPRSEFLTWFGWFWNSWASARDDVVLVVCGSATSWIANKLFKDRGGLHNRVTVRIHLEPFTLGEAEELCEANGLPWSRHTVLEAYMVFGGIPYYLELLNRRMGLPRNIDGLCFSPYGALHDEFDELFRSLFSKAGHHIEVVRKLARKQVGMSRAELERPSSGLTGGTLTKVLEELELCGFIRSYQPFGRKKRGTLYQLIDPFTLFYLRFVEGEADESFWSVNCSSPQLNTWRGYAFELVCLLHVRQIRRALGIEAISATVSSWRSRESDPGAQVDLVIDRRDGLVDLCEMKWSSSEYVITKAYDATLRRKRAAFAGETGTRKGCRTVLVTPNGVARNAYWGDIQAEVTADDLFA